MLETRKMSWLSIITVLVLLLLVPGRGQDNLCILEPAQDSCDACIGTSHLCSWCPYTPMSPLLRDFPRCDLAAGRSNCNGANLTLEDPPASLRVVRDEPLSTEVTVDSIQVAPQNVTLNLRAQMAQKFNMTFKSLRNSPLDVYILLDLSSSQAGILELLQNDLRSIANSLGEISNDFQMGLGSFVDKNIRPFALYSYEVIDNGTVKCRSFEECVPTYSFRNSQPLTSDISQIEISINDTFSLSTNVDAPEGGLEALLQVAVCTNETGWRLNALHMVFIITDQGYHLAGDGKLAGIVRPNDGRCHMDLNSEDIFEYTYGNIQDYPSVFQVLDALEQNNVVPIFVTQFDSPFLGATYNQLVSDFQRVGADYVNFEENSAERIIRIIRESYERTVQNIRVIAPAVLGYDFEITPGESCNVSRGPDMCVLQFDQNVTFEVSVTLTDCNLARSVGVQLRGPPFTFTYLKLNPLCSCNCSSQEPERSSRFCTDRGSLQCGQCECGPYFGDSCECDEIVMECPPGMVDNNPETCSGSGRCTTCGMCECFNNTFGPACQCNDQSCVNQCDGKGQCLCENPARCECDIDPESGFKYFQQTVEDSGSCICNPNDCFNPLFPGDLCHNVRDDLPGKDRCLCSASRGTCLCLDNLVSINNTCAPPSSFCGENELCARCAIEDIRNSSCDAANCRVTRYRELNNDEIASADNNLQCPYEVGACTFTFSFGQDDPEGEVVYSQQCSTSALPWIIAGSLVGLIFILGILALICLKLGFIIWDRIEYKRFTKDLSGPDFTPHENPLYMTPQTEIQNPLRRASRRKKVEGEEEL